MWRSHSTFRVTICPPVCDLVPETKPFVEMSRKYVLELSSRPYCGNPTTCDSCLRSIPKEAFADSFQKLYERCQPCVVKDDDYFEGQ
jgi:hypothetical protein